jgi:hypothetical protein
VCKKTFNLRPNWQWVKVKVKVILQLTVGQSLCQGIEPILALVTRYYFLSEGFFSLKFAVLPFWGALSDERSGLSFVFLCLVICHYLHQIFTFSNLYTINIKLQSVPFEYSRLRSASYFGSNILQESRQLNGRIDDRRQV